ncbi:tRNA-dihydrouridine synthase, partial [Acinetobacter baumannii]
IAEVREAVPLTVIANGEIWTVEPAALARERSGCEHLMLGRGMVADPGLARRVAGDCAAPLPWAELLPLMRVFFDQVRATVAPRHQGGRLKQWLHYQ